MSCAYGKKHHVKSPYKDVKTHPSLRQNFIHTFFKHPAPLIIYCSQHKIYNALRNTLILSGISLYTVMKRYNICTTICPVKTFVHSATRLSNRSESTKFQRHFNTRPDSLYIHYKWLPSPKDLRHNTKYTMYTTQNTSTQELALLFLGRKILLRTRYELLKTAQFLTLLTQGMRFTHNKCTRMHKKHR